MSQRYLRQKMILIQKNRENVQSMFEINQSLKMLKAEHDNVIEQMKLSQMQELDEIREQHAQ